MQGDIPLLIILLLLSAFFSGVETALVALSSTRVSMLLRKKMKGAHLLQRLKSDPHRMLSTILIGNNLVNIAAAAIMTQFMINLYGNKGVGIATGVLTLIILIFGEISPKSIATRYSSQISLATAPIILFLSNVFMPLIWVLDLFTIKVINKVMGPAPKHKITEEELKNYIKLSQRSGSIDKEETEMLQNIIEFEDVTVREIMTPKPQMRGVPTGTTVHDVVQLTMRTGHSRIPVFEKKGGKVAGVVLVKDLFKSMSEGKLNEAVDLHMREPHFVPESKKLDDLLKELRRGKTHIAMVVDEYGHVSGLVTLEDVLEEIVGDLFDETDSPKRDIKKLNANSYIISGVTYLDDINQELNVSLESESDAESLGGWIMEKLGRVAKDEDKVTERGMIFTVKGVKDNRITEVHLTMKRRTRKS